MDHAHVQCTMQHAQCWGMEYVAWHTGCKIDSGGWLQSSEENCGADTYPWPKFEMPELHWRRVDEQQRVSGS